MLRAETGVVLPQAKRGQGVPGAARNSERQGARCPCAPEKEPAFRTVGGDIRVVLSHPVGGDWFGQPQDTNTYRWVTGLLVWVKGFASRMKVGRVLLALPHEQLMERGPSLGRQSPCRGWVPRGLTLLAVPWRGPSSSPTPDSSLPGPWICFTREFWIEGDQVRPPPTLQRG